MAVPFTPTTGSASAGASEISLISGTTSLQASTTAGDVEIWIDLSNMVVGDQYQVRLVEKVNGGTAANAFISFPKDVQVGLYRVGPLRVSEGWDPRLKLTSGSARTVNWSIRQYVGDVNALTLGSGAVTATAIASSAITSAKFATDALDSNALAASAVTEIQTGLATSTALASVQTDTTTLTGRLTSTRAGLLDNLDATVSSRAASATALSTATWTNARAAEIDNLDAAVTTRAPASTALSTATWTNTLAALITSMLDVAVSTRASAAALAAVAAQLPATLDGSGNIKAGVQSIVGAAATTIADTVMNYAIESGWTNAATFITQARVMFGIIVNKASGLAITTGSTEHFRNAADTKDRAVYAVATVGTRTPATVDGT